MRQNNEIIELIAKRLSGEINRKESAIIEKWEQESPENKEIVQNFSKIWRESSKYGEDFNPDIQKAKEKFLQRVETHQKNIQKKKLEVKVFKYVAAASILLILSFGLQYLISDKDIIVQTYDNKKEVVLPDSSVVYLNKSTQIKYKERFAKRIIELEGEAFFEVKKKNNAPFVVNTPSTQVEVLGTSFNVKAYKNEQQTNLAVLTGKVAFSSTISNDKVLVEKKQQAQFNSSNKKMQKYALEDENFLVWKTGVLKYNNQPLRYIVKNLSEIYNLEISIIDNSINELLLTSEFKNQEIDDILLELEIILPVKINKKGKLVEISNAE